MNDLAPGKPWIYMPTAARIYCRKSQLPSGERFRNKTALAVDTLAEVDGESAAPVVPAFDRTHATEMVIEPCLHPPPRKRRINFAPHLRCDAQLHELLTATTKNPKSGRQRRWDQRLPSPREDDQWGVPWRRGRAYVAGRVCTFRYKPLRCCWAVGGPWEIMVVCVFEVLGYDIFWATITSANDLSASQRLAANGGRFRKEDGFHDHQQRLGMATCRAWTKEPVLRTFQI